MKAAVLKQDARLNGAFWILCKGPAELGTVALINGSAALGAVALSNGPAELETVALCKSTA
ncbi:MAG: hypothetical protein PUK70_03265 [Bacteroidales bacterium]|nr:hypothetical protein [Bacteroidales bacterium]MDY6001471.1 hypothetical protein [Candidatus Cryptobacteroides sp.]